MADAPGLVWADGRPMKRELLTQQVAAPSFASVRSIQSGHPAQGLTPARLARILLAAESGDATAFYELAEEMEEKDLHYMSVMATRKRAVCQLEISVEPADDSPQAKDDAALISDWLERDTLETELFDILDAIGKGTSASEILWETTSRTWLPREIVLCDPRFFEFDRETGQHLMLRENAGPQPLPAAKFIVHHHAAKSGIPIRGGLARAAAWGYMFKNYAIRDWVIFLESYGHPLRLGKYGPNESEANKRILMDALANLGTDAAASIPETMKVEFIDRKAGTSPNDLWRSMAEYFDQQISKAVLGQTNTTDAQSGGLGSGQANVHNEVRGDIERADAKLLAASLNRDLVRPMIMLNRGSREKYPRIKIGRPDNVDVAASVDAAAKLAEMGVPIGAEQMRERAGLPAPKDGEAALVVGGAKTVADPETDAQNDPAENRPQGPQESADGTAPAKLPAPNRLGGFKSATGANRERGETAAATEPAMDPEREPDGIDRAADEALSDWEAMLAPVIAPIEDMIAQTLAEGGTLEDVRGLLANELQSMDVSAVHNMLARAQFGSRLLGNLVEPGDV